MTISVHLISTWARAIAPHSYLRYARERERERERNPYRVSPSEGMGSGGDALRGRYPPLHSSVCFMHLVCGFNQSLRPLRCKL